MTSQSDQRRDLAVTAARADLSRLSAKMSARFQKRGYLTEHERQQVEDARAQLRRAQGRSEVTP